MRENFKRKVLKNGMTVLFEKRDLPIVSVAFAVKTGGINESVKEKGISHFIEHLLYKGTSTRNLRKIAEEIERNGGDLNGFTSELVTAYHCKMPSKHLNIALDVLSDMVKDPLFEKKEFEKERKVIFEEIKMKRDDPRVYSLLKIQESLYTDTMGMRLIGTFDTLKNITHDQILERFKKAYTPENMILIVVGDTNFNKLVKYVEENFGNEKGSITKRKFGKRNVVKTEKRKGIDQAHISFGYHVPLGNDKKSYAAKVLGVLMAGGFSSRLFVEIREKRNMAYAVKGGSDINKDFAFNYVYVGTRKENVGKVKKIILDELRDVAKNLTEGELKKFKEQIIGNYDISMEDSETQMDNLIFAEANGDAKRFYDFQKNIAKVKLKDVKELARKAAKKYSFFALVPE
jgi:predicted Zn-dependent peptidase